MAVVRGDQSRSVPVIHDGGVYQRNSGYIRSHPIWNNGDYCTPVYQRAGWADFCKQLGASVSRRTDCLQYGSVIVQPSDGRGLPCVEMGAPRKLANQSPVLFCDTLCWCCVGWKHERGLSWKHPSSAHQQFPHLGTDRMAHEYDHSVRNLVHHSHANEPVAVHVFRSLIHPHQYWVQCAHVAYVYVGRPRYFLGALQLNQHEPHHFGHLHIGFGSWLKFHTKCWLFNQHLLERHCLPSDQRSGSHRPYRS